MFARHNLHTKGYVVLYDAVPEDVVDHLRSLSRGNNTFWIHDTIDGILQDDHRLRAFVPDATSRGLSVDLERFYKTFFKESTATEWRFLRTVAGAEDQLIRRDLVPRMGTHTTNLCSTPGSIFIATQDHTCFYGYGWNHHVAMKSEHQLIELNNGDLLMCRGDFIYGAIGYKVNNVVVHGYIDIPMYARPVYQPPVMIPPTDDTRIHPDPFCFVWRCAFVGSDDNSQRKHLNRFHRFFFYRAH